MYLCVCMYVCMYVNIYTRTYIYTYVRNYVPQGGSKVGVELQAVRPSGDTRRLRGRMPEQV